MAISFIRLCLCGCVFVCVSVCACICTCTPVSGRVCVYSACVYFICLCCIRNCMNQTEIVMQSVKSTVSYSFRTQFSMYIIGMMAVAVVVVVVTSFIVVLQVDTQIQ